MFVTVHPYTGADMYVLPQPIIFNLSVVIPLCLLLNI
jgi:hypothetical protein